MYKEQDGYTYAQVDYAHKSAQSLRDYVNVNKSLTAKLRRSGTRELSAVITFKRPLPVIDFRNWVSRYPLQISRFTMRVIASDGSRVTVGGVTEDGRLVDEAHLNRILDIVARHGATDVRGIMSAEAVIPTSVYDQLVERPEVFLVDVTRSAVLEATAKVAPKSKLEPASILVPPTFPYMEDLGLRNFQ